MEAQEKVEIVNKYINSISSQDMDGIREIYDEQATVEDPIGTDAHVGIEAVCKFYEEGFDMGVKLELAGPVRCAGNATAFPVDLTVGIWAFVSNKYSRKVLASVLTFSGLVWAKLFASPISSLILKSS